MDALAEELERSLVFRLKYLETFLREVREELGPGRQGVSDAIRLAEFYPDWISRVAKKRRNRAAGSEDRVYLARALLGIVRKKTVFFESWLRRANSRRVPLSLVRAVERGCDELGLGRRKAVLAVGPPGWYETFVADLRSYLFSGLKPTPPPPVDIPPDLRSSRFALMLIPRFEGGEALWRPVVLGHELAHLRVRARGTVADLDVTSKIDWNRLPDPLPPFPRELGLTSRAALEQIADYWAEELICDAYAVRRFGPAAVAALAEFLDAVGMTDLVSFTHPPGWLRIRLLTRWLGEPHDPRIRRIVEPWFDLAKAPHEPYEPWAEAMVDELDKLTNEYTGVLDGWPPQYESGDRSELIGASADALKAGIPASSECTGDPRRQPYVQDILNAGWIGRTEQFETPLDKLVRKSLEDMEFVRLWRNAGGKSAESLGPRSEALIGGVLSAADLRRRLRAADESRLVITPRLEPSLGNSNIDLRLGSSFITFRRTATSSFDPIGKVQAPRTMQEDTERDWGETFVLHPGEMVLASTLEYVCLPEDVAAQVVTRSSYGRLGLITATAIQVHPHYKGCLTLELLNLGELPLELTPGERIAQLVFTRVDPPADPAETKYTYPVRPEFSKVRTDDEADVLRRLRDSTHFRYGRPPQK